MSDAVVVTGIGALAPNGIGIEAYWSAVRKGRSGLGRITRFDPAGYPTQVAGEVDGFDAAAMVPGRLIPQTDRWTQLGLVAADLALRDARVNPAELPEYDMAVIVASSSGGTEFGQREIESLWSRGPGWVGAFQSIAWFYAATTGQIAIKHGMRGPCGVLCAEQAGGLDAISQARRVLREGRRLALTGGADSSLCPYGLVAQLPTGRLSPVLDPARAYLPFDEQAAGYVPGEGGAILVAEPRAAALARGAFVYGEIAGHAATFDPPGAARSNLARAARQCLAQAGIRPSEVDVVFADGAGVPELDRQEAEAIEAVFGPLAVPVTVPKAMTGRLYAGGAALDVATALLAVRDGFVPPTVGVRTPRFEDRLDLVTEPRHLPVRRALVLARGHGGFNSALLVAALEERSKK